MPARICNASTPTSRLEEVRALSTIQVPPLDERAHLAIGDRALQHPEATIRMRPLHASPPQHLVRLLEAAGDRLRCLRLIILDVNDSEPHGNRGLQISKDI